MIILCGGTGSRMFPLTHSINKQLLPVYDKPMFYYPLSLMMLCGIKEYIFVINQGQEQNFKKALGNADDLGIKVVCYSRKPKRSTRCFFNYKGIN